MITLFTIPRAFTGGDKIRQENTLGAWSHLDPRPEIILFGNDPGIAEAARQYNCVHVPDIRCNEDGIPYVSHVFQLVSQLATNSTLCYANADIIFVQDFIKATMVVKKSFNDPFLIIGQRWNVPVPGPLEFTDGWQERLLSQIKQHRGKISTSAIDYLIYTKGAVVSIPDFLVGSPKWDNWTVSNAESRGIQVVSATKAITCIHQEHEHRWPLKGAEYNHGLWWRSGGGVGYVYSGSWILGAGNKLTKKPWMPPPAPSQVEVRPQKTVAKPQTVARPKPAFKPRFKHKPVATPPGSKSRPAQPPPTDVNGLPINVNISAGELEPSAKKIRRQAEQQSGRRKHSHTSSEREAALAERARLEAIRNKVHAARIAARNERLRKR